VPKFFRDSRHLALHVDSVEVLEEYARRLEEAGWKVEMRVRHETIESIYTHDPNGYLVEFTTPVREITDVDDRDAVLTLKALLDVTREPDPSMAKLWARKAQLIGQSAP
jgi:catechol-2,3-dioxygenase